VTTNATSTPITNGVEFHIPQTELGGGHRTIGFEVLTSVDSSDDSDAVPSVGGTYKEIEVAL
jgi:hypothetical protein